MLGVPTPLIVGTHPRELTLAVQYAKVPPLLSTKNTGLV
jgi:hypothetical protein